MTDKSRLFLSNGMFLQESQFNVEQL